jgi:EAL and modified HD-GYP domain-containing signal transduction protein
MMDPAFIVGLMSVMPAALEMPMGEILEQITVTDEVRAALESRGGQLGQLLELVEHYDDNNIDGAAGMLARMGGRLGHQTLNLCLSEAIAWMMNLGQEAA